MRKFRFRAWDTEKNKMVKVDTIDFNNGNVNDVDFYNQEIHFGFSTILLQYTGLKDKNGTEIYEGDILTDHGDEGPLYVEYSNERAMFVFVDKFDPFGVTSYSTLQISYEQFEVIGNIYENPELLEVD